MADVELSRDITEYKYNGYKVKHIKRKIYGEYGEYIDREIEIYFKRKIVRTLSNNNGRTGYAERTIDTMINADKWQEASKKLKEKEKFADKMRKELYKLDKEIHALTIATTGAVI